MLHMVVVGGGPSGVEYAAELHDFIVEDLVRGGWRTRHASDRCV